MPAQKQLPVLKVMYLFAGRQRHSDIGSFLRKAEESGHFKLELMEFHIERSPDQDLSDRALWDRIIALLKEGDWVLIVSTPCNTFSRARFQRKHLGPKPLRTNTWPRGFPWLGKIDRAKVEEANMFVDNCLLACDVTASAGGIFLLEHPEDLGAVQGIRPGSIWQWEELLELIPKFGACCFAVHQCKFGGATPKPTRFLSSFQVNDPRCYCSLPKFDRLGSYKGPLPRDCGHVHEHKLIGKTGSQWNTAPSASYPPDLCQFLAGLILDAKAPYGRGEKNESLPKRRRVAESVEAQSPAPSTKHEVHVHEGSGLLERVKFTHAMLAQFYRKATQSLRDQNHRCQTTLKSLQFLRTVGTFLTCLHVETQGANRS